MSENIPSWFIQKYDDQVTILAQQRERRLAGMTSGGGMFIGDHIYFSRMGSVEMYDSVRFAALALANGQMDMISVQAKPKFVAMGIWDPDVKKLNVNMATEYARATSFAGMRAEDNLVINALNNAAVNGVTGANADGTTNTQQIATIGSYTTVADLDTFAQAIAQLGTQEKFEGEEICAVVPFKVKVQNSLDPYMAYSNVKNNLPWDMVNFRSFERLYDQSGSPITQASSLPGGSSTGVDMYLFARSAVSSDYNNEMTTINERIGASLTTMLGAWFQAGAVVKDALGVIRIKSQYNFALNRKAIPFFDEALGSGPGL